MRFEAAHSKSVIMTGGIIIVNKVLPTDEIQPKMVALHEGDLLRKSQGFTAFWQQIKHTYIVILCHHPFLSAHQSRKG